MSACKSFPTCPQHLALLQDNRLTILERNALLVLAAHVDPVSDAAMISYEQLRPYLAYPTAGTQAAVETVNRAIIV